MNDQWKEGRSTLPPGLYSSYDGSLHPDQFMAYCESGEALLTPTDKNYKVYIEVEVQEGKDQLRIVSYTSGNSKKPGSTPVYGEYTLVKNTDLTNVDTSGWRNLDPEGWIQLAPVGTRRSGKFYFERLSDVQKTRFIELFNEKRLRLEYPGHFYNLPFFMSYGAS